MSEELVVRSQPVCKSCAWESLHYCTKYNKKLISVRFNDKRYQLSCKDCKKDKGREFFPTTLKKEKSDTKVGLFHLPGTENLKIFASFIKMREAYPEAFYANRRVSEIYGAFPGTIWNGRSPNFNGESFSKQRILDYKAQIEDLGISLNLTWNNHLVKNNDIYDRYCNMVTEIFHTGKHSITVASPELFEYLYKNYPNYTYYKSVITTEKNNMFIKEDNRYSIFLMNRKLNNNWEELLKIPIEERSSIEFLCNDACTPLCDRTVHYNYVNSRLLDREEEEIDIHKYCTIDHDFMIYNLKNWPFTIRSEDIDKYIENNFIHFKLCSRGDSPPIIAFKVVEYLAKPQYFGDIFAWAINGKIYPEEKMYK